MINKTFFLPIIFLLLLFNVSSGYSAKNNYFEKGKNLFDKNEFEKSKFFFEKDIVFNPKSEKSYLYLAKIYNFQENQIEEIKNLETTLLLEPDNEEALYMLMKVNLKKSNFSEVKNLKKKFEIVCSSLCNKTKDINEGLKNIETEKDSKQ